MHSIAIRGARAARIIDRIAAELTKLARSGSAFGECERVIAFVYRSHY